MVSVYYTWNVVISYYSIVLATLGTIGNFIACAICLRKSLRKVPTFIFFAIMSLTNAFALYYWNLNDYFLTFFGHTMGDFNELSCKISTFLQMFFSQSSSFLLVSLTSKKIDFRFLIH